MGGILLRIHRKMQNKEKSWGTKYEMYTSILIIDFLLNDLNCTHNIESSVIKGVTGVALLVEHRIQTQRSAVRTLPASGAQEKKRKCADSLSVCPTPMCIDIYARIRTIPYAR